VVDDDDVEMEMCRSTSLACLGVGGLGAGVSPADPQRHDTYRLSSDCSTAGRRGSRRGRRATTVA